MKRTNIFRPNKGVGSKVFNGRAHIDALYKTPEWTEYRIRYLEINKKCYCCGRASTVVDHLKVHRGDIALFEKNDNHIPVCTECHNKITALFDRYPVQKYQEKLNWMSVSRGRNDLSFKVMVIPYRLRP